MGAVEKGDQRSFGRKTDGAELSKGRQCRILRCFRGEDALAARIGGDIVRLRVVRRNVPVATRKSAAVGLHTEGLNMLVEFFLLSQSVIWG